MKFDDYLNEQLKSPEFKKEYDDLKPLRYQVFEDGRNTMEFENLKEAKFHAETALLNAKQSVEIYDSETDSIMKTYCPEEL